MGPRATRPLLHVDVALCVADPLMCLPCFRYLKPKGDKAAAGKGTREKGSLEVSGEDTGEDAAGAIVEEDARNVPATALAGGPAADAAANGMANLKVD